MENCKGYQFWHVKVDEKIDIELQGWPAVLAGAKLDEGYRIENCKGGNVFWQVKIDEKIDGELQGCPVLAGTLDQEIYRELQGLPVLAGES